jgi:hypothetical protein
LLFDVANVRVNTYLPDERLDQARAFISDSIIAALHELDLRRSLAVGKASRRILSARMVRFELRSC